MHGRVSQWDARKGTFLELRRFPRALEPHAGSGRRKRCYGYIPPMDRSAPIPVVAAVIQRGGRYLLGLRPPSKRHGGLWEFPGGKLRPRESTLDGLRRELAEEMNVRCVGMGAVRWTAADPGSPFVIEFVEATIEGEPVADEHDALGWFTPDELAAMPLAPSDAAFAQRLRESGHGSGTP